MTCLFIFFCVSWRVFWAPNYTQIPFHTHNKGTWCMGHPHTLTWRDASMRLDRWTAFHTDRRHTWHPRGLTGCEASIRSSDWTACYTYHMDTWLCCGLTGCANSNYWRKRTAHHTPHSDAGWTLLLPCVLRSPSFFLKTKIKWITLIETLKQTESTLQ